MIKTEKDEKIILEARRHWFVILPQAVISSFLVIVPLVGYLVLEFFFDTKFSFDGGNFLALIAFVYFVWVLVLWTFFFIEWTNYYLDVWYITNKRIIDVEQKGIFHREVISLRYRQIQNVTAEVRGVIATLFGFGDIHVQTAATDRREIILKSAADFSKVKKTILAIQDQVRERERTVRIDPSDFPPDIAEKIS